MKIYSHLCALKKTNKLCTMLCLVCCMLCYELIIHFDFNPFLRILSTLSLMNARKKKKIRMYFLRKKKSISFRMKKKDGA